MQNNTKDTIKLGNLTIDRYGHRVYCCNSIIPISALNFRLLLHLLDNANRVCTYNDLLVEVWGYAQCDNESHLVKLAISRLRKILNSCQSRNKAPIEIHNVRGVGYRLDIRENE